MSWANRPVINAGRYPSADEIEAVLDQIEAIGVTVSPTTTASNGTATSGTTETRDAVLGNYQFNADSTRRYRVWWTGKLNTDTNGDLITVNVRDGGSSTPTSASTLVGTGQIRLAQSGGTGQESLIATGTFTTTEGLRTLAAFTLRSSGAGIETPVGTRELYVEDIGGA